ncbi:MAG: elongation factor G, partial [Flavobacteriaceae bacterium]|nr:elongation factor G [Flavobacteriaceae bacterium]
EPINDLEVLVPEEMMGNVMTDLQARRSIIIGMDSVGRYQRIKAKTPQAELHNFSTTLRSLSQGKGTFSTKFATFEQVPTNIQQELVK